MPREQRSGVSAMVGLALVVALLLVAGTLAVSGGGILSGGGRIGVETASSPSAGPNGDGQGSVTGAATPTPRSTPGGAANTKVTNRLDQVCEPVGGSIRDGNKAKWQIHQFLAGSRDTFERVTWELRRRSPNNKVPATEVTLEWMSVREARDAFDLSRLPGQQALVITFDGEVTSEKTQTLDSLFLDREGVQGIRSIQMFEHDGKVRTVVGLQRGYCVKLAAPLWKKTAKKRAKMFLDVSVPD